jgi:hypothetical protein
MLEGSVQGHAHIVTGAMKAKAALVDQTKTLVNPRGILRAKPHITWDNFFSGVSVAIWCADQGFGMTSTLRRDCFPQGVLKYFFHGQKMTPKDNRAKVAKFLMPIVATKNIDNGVLQLTSFQSTSCCNFLSVNAYNQCGLYAHAKERGSLKHGTKRSWAIEMNDARELYLATYGAIDTMDHLIKNCDMKYRSWKYWHAAMLLAKTMAIVVAYDMYKEAAKGTLNPDWKVEKPVSFFVFREELARSMLQYTPTARNYPGDSFVRVSTQQHSDHRSNDSTFKSKKKRKN